VFALGITGIETIMKNRAKLGLRANNRRRQASHQAFAARFVEECGQI